jgi:hypothetical protein
MRGECRFARMHLRGDSRRGIEWHRPASEGRIDCWRTAAEDELMDLDWSRAYCREHSLHPAARQAVYANTKRAQAPTKPIRVVVPEL